MAITGIGAGAGRAGAQNLPAPRPAVDSAIAFPDVARATRPHGVFVPPRSVLMVSDGMTKGQVYTLLDVPHFSEGLFAVRKWNYILNFHTGSGDAFVACQYQLRFDGRGRVAGRWWKDQSCADLVDRLVAEPTPVIVERPRDRDTPIERPAKTYEFTFDFDSDTILPGGEQVIRTVASDAVVGQYTRILVSGFTDTAGSQGYNDNLAIRRAAAVATRLTALLPPGGLRADAVAVRGGRELAVPTGDQVREIRNRRVRIELMQQAGSN